MPTNTTQKKLRKTNIGTLICVAGITVLISSGIANAEQPYKPIAQVENLSIYFLSTRCAGLMTAVSYWMGSDAKDKDLQSSIMNNANLFTALAIQDGSDSNISIEDLRSQVVQQVKTTRDMYLSRFRDNYAGGGQGYGDDEEVKSDIVFCQYAKEKILPKQ